jgi:hypothetical protein
MCPGAFAPMACASEAWSCVEPMAAANWLRQKESWHLVGV